MAVIGFVAASTTAGVEVSEETINDVETAYEFLRTHPDQKGHAKFDSKEERLGWVRQVKAYTKGREEGALSFRLLPDKAKTLGPDEFYFRLTADLPANGARSDVTHA
jgi:hypothetical protein